MALRDISNVTTALMNLIERSFRVPENWVAMMGIPRVLPEAPVRTRTNGVGMFLYHITEHPHYKNLPAPGYETPPVRYTSMGLTLYYQLSTFQNSSAYEGEQDGLMEQQMLAVAMKALHDYPELTDDTIVIGAVDAFNVPITSPVFPMDIIGRSNRFKIVYQPIQPAESISFWSTGDSRLTLSAYYEVNVVLLEPETTRTRSGRVLDFNVFSFVSGNPKILSSSNEATFISPVDGRSRQLIMQPAQVPPADSPPPLDLVPYTLTLKGLDFTSDIFLRLTNRLWDGPAILTAAWDVTSSATEFNAVVQETAIVESTGLPVAILPGIYGAQLVAQSIKNKSDGTQWPIELTSNVSPFAIVPRIDTLTTPATLIASATLMGYVFTALDGLGNELIEVDVFVGRSRLEQVSAAPVQGEFRIVSASQIDYCFPVDTVSGDVLPIRVFANGVESSPLWITAP